jgi:Dyp-type peroxidase family
MAGAPVKARAIDYGDVQGLVRFGHGQLEGASFALLRVKSREAAKAWLCAAPVTSAVAVTPLPTTALQVAFTAAGLEALGVAPAVLGGFSREFVGGMTEPNRARRLGDVEANAPSTWAWGRPEQPLHVLAMFFAKRPLLDGFIRDTTREGWSEAFETQTWLATSDLDGVEPFGFTDGISQPEIDWQQERDPAEGRLDYGNVAALGEFLLGYRNEYGKYSDRPLLDAAPTNDGLPEAEDAPGKRDFGRNGTFVVLRQLRQDVRAFWRFAYEQAGGDAARADGVAAALVGRTKNGDPLVPLADQPIVGIKAGKGRQNLFTYDGDPRGVRCPIGSHIRRANPRNTDYPGRPTGLRRILADLGLLPRVFADDLVSSVRFHRILRRGREYGPGLSPQDALRPPPPNEEERGLHFICLNGNIGRQFEFLQNAWMTSSKFAGLTGENDPLIGIRDAIRGCPAADAFTWPTEDGLARRVNGLPQFVTVRGGGYFFMPGLGALRFLATS